MQTLNECLKTNKNKGSKKNINNKKAEAEHTECRIIVIDTLSGSERIKHLIGKQETKYEQITDTTDKGAILAN